MITVTIVGPEASQSYGPFVSYAKAEVFGQESGYVFRITTDLSPKGN